MRVRVAVLISVAGSLVVLLLWHFHSRDRAGNLVSSAFAPGSTEALSPQMLIPSKEAACLHSAWELVNVYGIRRRRDAATERGAAQRNPPP
jgi:hypothetical protein